MICEHASNNIPFEYNGLNLNSEDLHKHIAWDVGAENTAKILAQLLDAPLVCANYSRLLLDLNRALDAPDSIVEISEDIVITGNLQLNAEQRAHRQSLYASFHDVVSRVISNKLMSFQEIVVISIHSFTPVYHGEQRPWHIGVLAQNDRRLADVLLTEFKHDSRWCVGNNQPYEPRDGVYHTMQIHAENRGLPCAMLEIRNDLISDTNGQRTWAQQIADSIHIAIKLLFPTPQIGRSAHEPSST